MYQYRVVGVSKHTRENIDIRLQCESVEAVAKQATAMGIAVKSIEMVEVVRRRDTTAADETPQPSPMPSRHDFSGQEEENLISDALRDYGSKPNDFTCIPGTETSERSRESQPPTQHRSFRRNPKVPAGSREGGATKKRNWPANLGALFGVGSLVTLGGVGILPMLALLLSFIGLYTARTKKSGAWASGVGITLGVIYMWVYMKKFGHL